MTSRRAGLILLQTSRPSRLHDWLAKQHSPRPPPASDRPERRFHHPSGLDVRSFLGLDEFRDLALELFRLGFQPGNLGGDRLCQIGSDLV